jgi:hypothetical protein
MPAPAGDPTRCRVCGGPMGWPAPVGVVFADSSAAHHACDEAPEPGRTSGEADHAASPEAPADPAIRGE